MTSSDLAKKVRKVLEMSRDESFVKGVYFNPLFAGKLSSKVPELHEAGLSLSMTSTKDPEGPIKSSAISSALGDRLKLGSVFLDGENVLFRGKLVLIDDLVDFVEENSLETRTKGIEED